jgi:hypothetical protein
MTTTVKITACCEPTTTEVVVTVDENFQKVEDIVLQNGETVERYVYGNRAITVREVTKGE